MSQSSFAVEFSSQGAPVPLLQEIAERVFQHARCVSPPVSELAAALERATAGSAFGPGRCDVQMRATPQQLEILVSANGGRVWQGICAIGPQDA